MGTGLFVAMVPETDWAKVMGIERHDRKERTRVQKKGKRMSLTINFDVIWHFRMRRAVSHAGEIV
jgi:hypothetical protein